MDTEIGTEWGEERYAGPKYGWKSKDEYNKLLESGALGRGQQTVEMFGSHLLSHASKLHGKWEKHVGKYIPDIPEPNEKVKETLSTAKDIAGHAYNWSIRENVEHAMAVLGVPVEATHWVSKKVDPTGRGIGKAPLGIAETVLTAGGPAALKGGKTLISKSDDIARLLSKTDDLAFATNGVLSQGVNARLTNQPLVSNVFASTSVPNYPALKPHRSFKTTSKLKTLDEYKDTWRNWPDKTKVGRDKFYKKHGMWITDEGFKMKPDALRQSPADKAENIKRFGNEMNIRSDKGVWTRKQRGDILTYMSGETPVSTKAASYKDPVTGANIIPHHRTSHGELAPWTDVIIDKLNSADPLIKAEGKEMLEIGKDIFKKFDIKVGDTLKNYEGYFHEAHLGPNSIHDLLTQHKITGPSSRSAFDFTKGQNALSKGIKVGDKTIPTTEYIRNLPWKREQVFKYRKNIIAEGKGSGKYIKGGEPITEANTFWNTLIEYIQTSNQPRQVAREEVLETFGKQGKNWAKGEI